MSMTDTEQEASDDIEYEAWVNFYGPKRWQAKLDEYERRGRKEGREEGQEELLAMMMKLKYSLAALEEITSWSREKILQIAEKYHLSVK